MDITRLSSIIRWAKSSFILNTIIPNSRSRERSVGIATRYGLDGPGIESVVQENTGDRCWVEFW